MAENSELNIQAENNIARKVELSVDMNKRVPQANYRNDVLMDLQENRPGEDEIMVVVLTRKLESLTDMDMNKSPVFVFGGKDYDAAVPVVTEWVDSIDKTHYVLPALTVPYYMAIMKGEQFDQLLADPINSIPSENQVLISAAVKYKEALAEAAEPGANIESVQKQGVEMESK